RRLHARARLRRAVGRGARRSAGAGPAEQAVRARAMSEANRRGEGTPTASPAGRGGSPGGSMSVSRAGLRRLVAMHADGRRGGLRPRLVDPAVTGPAPITGVEHRFLDYLLDGCGGPLVARGAPDLAWFERSLLVAPLAPGSAVPIADDLAAIVAAPRLVAS